MFHLESQLAYISKINNYLFLSSVESLLNKEKLAKRNIKFVISILQTPTETPDPNIKQLVIPIPDSAEINIDDYFEKAFLFIKEARAINANILIHCEKGISRSASFVIAWLMYEKHMQGQLVNYTDILQFVQQKRGVVSPNPGFTKQLQNFAKKLNNSVYENTNAQDTLGEVMSYLPPSNLIKMHLVSKFFDGFLNKNINFIWKDYLRKNFNVSNEDINFLEKQNYSFSKIYQTYAALDNAKIPKKNLSIVLGFIGEESLCESYLSIYGCSKPVIMDFIFGAIHNRKNTLAEKFCNQIDSAEIYIILLNAVSANNIDFIKNLEEKFKLNWQQKNGNGNNLLFLAAYYGSYETFVYLYEIKKIDAYVENNGGANLLESLCHTKNANLIEYVKENLRDLDPFKPNNSSLTPYMLAVRKGNNTLINAFDTWAIKEKIFSLK